MLSNVKKKRNRFAQANLVIFKRKLQHHPKSNIVLFAQNMIRLPQPNDQCEWDNVKMNVTAKVREEKWLEDYSIATENKWMIWLKSMFAFARSMSRSSLYCLSRWWIKQGQFGRKCRQVNTNIVPRYISLTLNIKVATFGFHFTPHQPSKGQFSIVHTSFSPKNWLIAGRV